MSKSAELLQAMKEEAKPGIWSQGVNLARAGAVALGAQSEEEVELRVRPSNRPVPLTVILYPEDEGWECSCPSRVDPCEHAVAAAIAWDQSSKQDAPLKKAEARWARLQYRFSREKDGLSLQRYLVHAERPSEKLEGSLAAALGKSEIKATLQVEEADLLADRLLERGVRGALPAERLLSLVKILQGARNVLVDGREVEVAEAPVFPSVSVEDEADGFKVVLKKDARITAVVSPGVALCKESLALLGEREMTGDWLQKLPLVRVFSPAQRAELSSEYLPALASRLPIQMRTKRLPSIDRSLGPRVEIRLTQIDSGLSVLPTLVYGAPPQVRIDAGKMTYLRGAVPIRDLSAEQRLSEKLRTDLDLVLGRRIQVEGAELPGFLDKLRSWHASLVGDTRALLREKVRLIPELHLGTEGGDAASPQLAFNLAFRIEGGEKGEQVDAESVLRAWQQGIGLVPLPGGGFAPLPTAFMEKHGQRVEDLLSAKDAEGQVAKHALPALAELCESLDQPPPLGLEKLAPLLEGFERLPPPRLPDSLQAELRPYQAQGVSWLQFLVQAELGGILADDMGLGKTLQTLVVAEKGTLVVCPTSVLPNWKAEAERFRPDLKVSVYHGPRRVLDDDADITLTSYALLRLDADLLKSRQWKLVVLDEAQWIKNPSSQVAQSAFSLSAKSRVALSGTPLENRLDELWSLMHFCNPGLLGGRHAFEQRFASPAALGDGTRLSDLRKKIKPFLLRRLKKDVAKDLPPKTEAVMRVELAESERVVYDAVLAATRKDVVAQLEKGGSVLKALEALLRLRQAACHPALVPGQQAATSSKLESLMSALANLIADGHRALVFSQWTSLLDLLEPLLKASGVEYLRLDGSTPNRGELTARFQSEEGPPVMILSLKAAGVGLNLSAADHVFLLDPWWNPAVEAQATDRAHRIGQERPVIVYRLVAEDTVEEKILHLQQAKRALFEAALSEGGAATGMTREDWAFLPRFASMLSKSRGVQGAFR